MVLVPCAYLGCATHDQRLGHDTLARAASTLSMHDDKMPGFHLHLFNWNGKVDKRHSPIHKRHIPVCETTNRINPSFTHPAMCGPCGSPLG